MRIRSLHKKDNIVIVFRSLQKSDKEVIFGKISRYVFEPEKEKENTATDFNWYAAIY